jgi:hypothetical protein
VGLIGWLLLMLWGVGPLAGQVPPVETPARDLRAGEGHRREPPPNLLQEDAEASALGWETTWRRTRDGWERPGQWTFHRKSHPPALHPIVVALLEVFLALAALIALPETGNRRSGPKSKAALRPSPCRREGSTRARVGPQSESNGTSPRLQPGG